MNRTMRSMIFLLVISSFILHPSSFLRADGGTLRLSEQKGNYRITVFTSPTVVRAGPVDISVLVQDAATGELPSEVRISIEIVRSGSIETALRRPATAAAATNKLYYATSFELPEAGRYSVEVFVGGVLGEAKVCFEMEAAKPLPSWLALLAWVGWPVVVVALFIIHQILSQRRSR